MPILIEEICHLEKQNHLAQDAGVQRRARFYAADVPTPN